MTMQHREHERRGFMKRTNEPESLLAAEVDCVVNSPYPTQLKQLRDIVCAKCSNADIAKCFRIHACKIDALVVCLLEGLQQWPYVLDIIIRLAYVPAIRDALLTYEPNFLHDLLAQVFKTDDVQSKYASAAVAMLSHPPPDNFALPAEVQTLFLRLVDFAAQTPSSSTIRPLHRLLRGISTGLLGLLSDQVLRQFQDQLFGILRCSTIRGTQDAEDHCLALYCLAIMQQITSASEEHLLLNNSFYVTQELLASTQPVPSRWDANAMSEFFTGSGKAHKTLQLVVLRVLEACRNHAGSSLATSLETLSLANELVDAFPVDVRSSWCAANTATVLRLQQKALNANTDACLRLQALSFGQALDQSCVLPQSREALQKMLVHPKRFVEVSYGADDYVWSRCILHSLDQRTNKALIRNIIDYILDASPLEMIEGSGVLTSLLERLEGVTDETGDNVDGETTTYSEICPKSRLQALAASVSPANPTEVMNHNASPCYQRYLDARNKTVHALSSLLLRSILRTGQRIPEQTTKLLLRVHASSVRNQPSCCHARPRPSTSIAFIEQASTPLDSAPQWRELLRWQLQQQAQTNHENISKVFAHACADLEARCEGVEQPLHQEQESKAALQKEYDHLSASFAEAEAQALERTLQLSSLQEEKDQCMSELDDARTAVDQALGKIDHLQNHLQQVKLDAEAELAKSRRARETADMEHATTVAEKEAEIEELQEGFDMAHSALRQKTAELEQTRKGLEDFGAAKAELHVEAERLRGVSQEKQATIDRLGCEVRDAAGRCDDLESEVQGLRGASQEKQATIYKLEGAIRDAAGRFDDLTTEMQSLREEHERARLAHEQHLQQIKDHSKEALQAANASHNETMDRLAAQHGEEVADVERKLHDAHEESRRLEEQHGVELAQRDERMAELREKIKRLKRECQDRERQITEANAMRNNLMAAMGLGGIQVPASLPHRTRSSAPLTQTDYSQLEMSPAKVLHAEEENTQRFDGKASLGSTPSSGESRTEPTPKRAKPRKSIIKATSPAKTRRSTGTRFGQASLLGRSTVKRQPLAGINANRSPEKVASKTPCKPSATQDAADFDDTTFDEHSVFDETPGRRMMDVENMLDNGP